MDDIIVIKTSVDIVQEFINLFHSQFALKDIGVLSLFLGNVILRTSDYLHLSQLKYLKDLLDKVEMSDIKSLPSPMPIDKQLSTYDG